jgi:hypothetical protein
VIEILAEPAAEVTADGPSEEKAIDDEISKEESKDKDLDEITQSSEIKKPLEDSVKLEQKEIEEIPVAAEVLSEEVKSDTKEE